MLDPLECCIPSSALHALWMASGSLNPQPIEDVVDVNSLGLMHFGDT